jgi:anti-sigma regulatory factor (Ser/Thr protein kinase)
MPHKNSLLAPSTLLPVIDPSSAGEVRRFCQVAAGQLGFDEGQTGRVSIVATELATNLVRHARGGFVIARVYESGAAGVLDLLAIDRGPGMRDVDRCMEDGYSTASGGSGSGLGAIQRLADEFDIFSDPEIGTAVLARFGAVRERSGMDIGALSLPYPGETVCGDAWAIAQSLERCSIGVIDGLGHGPDAGRAAQEALRVMAAHPELSAEQTLESAHGALKHTRGAAMAVAEIDLRARQIRFAGVGNVVGATASATSLKRMVSYDGTIGHETSQIKRFDYALDPEHLIIMHSDGLKTQWRLDRYRGLLRRDPFLIAGMLYRDYFRGQDDVTVVVARVAAP